MKAMILAAGLGTRLRPLTNEIPKALVKVHGLPMLEIILRRLSYYGFKEVIINLHHKADMIIGFLESRRYLGLKIHFSNETNRILDTGGGIMNARGLLNDRNSFLVHNVDVISDIDMMAFYHHHIDQGNLATLAVKGRNCDRSLLFDNKWQLTGWENRHTGEKKMISGKNTGDHTAMGFCGIYVIDPGIFKFMKSGVFSIIDTLIGLAPDHRIQGFPVDNNTWIDIGSHEQLKTANELDPSVYLPE